MSESPSASAADFPACPHCEGQHPEEVLACPVTAMVLPLEGRLLEGRFRFLRQIGTGGMATVWLAKNERVDREVAIKILQPSVASNQEALARFRSEAKAAGRIGNPHICEVLDLGDGPIGPYIVMERLEGRDLAEVIEEKRRLDPGEAVAIVREALVGLEAAHKANIVHRDLKPGNLFLHYADDARVIKIMDFGVSKFMDGTGEVRTADGFLLGTPEYMAPEQLRGASKIDETADIWSVGAILYRALTGHQVFSGPDLPSVLKAMATQEPTPIQQLVDGVPTGVIRVVERCLQRDPLARYGTVAELAAALEPFEGEIRSDLGAPLPGRGSARDELVDPDEPPTHLFRPDGPEGRDGAGPSPAPSPDQGGAARPSSASGAKTSGASPQAKSWVWIVVVACLALLAVAWWYAARRVVHTETEALQTAGESPGTGDAALGSTNAAPEPTRETSTDTSSTSHGTPTEAEPETGTTGGEPTIEPDSAAELGPEPIVEPEPESLPSEKGGTDTGKPNEGQPVTDRAAPKGSVRAGGSIASLSVGPTQDQKDAVKYCNGLAARKHLGLSGWQLPNPAQLRSFASAAGIRRARYWTTAIWQGKATVISVPSGRKSSVKIDRPSARALCVRRY